MDETTPLSVAGIAPAASLQAGLRPVTTNIVAVVMKPAEPKAAPIQLIASREVKPMTMFSHKATKFMKNSVQRSDLDGRLPAG